jgi:hypothetical protein
LPASKYRSHFSSPDLLYEATMILGTAVISNGAVEEKSFVVTP